MSESPSMFGSRWSDSDVIRTTAYSVIIACGSWWLLGQLAIVLRPLLVAIFLAYVLLPLISKVRKVMPGPVAYIALAALVATSLAAMAVTVYASILSFQEDIPRIKARTINIAQTCGDYVERNVPWILPASKDDPKAEKSQENAHGEKPQKRPEVVFAERFAELTNEQAGRAAGYAASGVSEGIVAGLFLFFLLLEASRFPDRVKKAYTPNKANSILYVSERITAAVHGYLKAKSVSGLISTIAVVAVLWIFGVKFVFLWGALTFFCNFIPYVGSLIAFALPATFAGLMLPGSWQPITCVSLLMAVHLITGTFVEPMIIGKAVGLSPIVILAALTLWGTIWGLPGMFLAVPLTMVILIVLDNIPSTRSIARLFLSEE